MTEKSHTIRVILILLGAIGSSVGAFFAEKAHMTGLAATLLGSAAVLIPAFVDSVKVKWDFVKERRKSVRPPAGTPSIVPTPSTPTPPSEPPTT